MEYQSFIYSSYQPQAVTADAEDLYNFYTERYESPGATSKWGLCPTPGVTLLSTAATGAGRGHFVAAGREFCVIGTTLYEVGQFGSLTSRGTVAIGANPATFAYNGAGGDQLFVTSGSNGYIFNLATSAFTQIAALNGKATMGDHLDGYFLALDANTSTFYISDLIDGLTWATGTNFAQRSKQPDPWRAMKVNGNFIWLIGELTGEVWFDTGASFPFAPHTSGSIPYGIVAPFSLATVGTGLAWLATSAAGGVYPIQAQGFTPEVIANLPLQLALSGYSVVADAVADSYTDLGHTFYVLTFPTEGITWAWDATTGQWAKRGTWDLIASQYTEWRPRWHAAAFGEHRMLDGNTGAVYRLSSTVATDVDDLLIRRLRRAPTLMYENDRVYYQAFELDLEPGLGVSNGQGSNPQVMLRMSNDGGKTWSSEAWRTAGAQGNYSTRVRWNRLGTGRRRVFEVSFSDPTPWRITNAYLTLGQSARAQPEQQATQ